MYPRYDDGDDDPRMPRAAEKSILGGGARIDGLSSFRGAGMASLLGSLPCHLLEAYSVSVYRPD
jgi:hypothetical protein